ncbi:MAG: sigma-70 family RNA polymerase sigma factor [Cyanobacteria bacterium P01_E01_bin.42]
MTSRTTNTEQNLIDNGATKGDRSPLISQFWQQWQESRDRLYHCCLKMMNFNPMDAEDALSQAMIKAWDRVQTFGEKITNLKAWLYRVTRNFCIDLIRKGSRAAVGVESIEWVGNTEEVITTGTGECPESVLEREERSDMIQSAIAELPENLQKTFILHFYRELSHQEIAEQQGISYGNVCKRISLARKQLKESLKGYFRGTDGEVRETKEIRKEAEILKSVDSSVSSKELANQTIEEIVTVLPEECVGEIKAEIPKFVDSSVELRELVSQTITKVVERSREFLRYDYLWRSLLMSPRKIFRLPVLLLSWIQDNTTSGFITPLIENLKLSSIAHCSSKYIGRTWDRTLEDTGGAIVIFFE